MKELSRALPSPLHEQMSVHGPRSADLRSSWCCRAQAGAGSKLDDISNRPASKPVELQGLHPYPQSPVQLRVRRAYCAATAARLLQASKGAMGILAGTADSLTSVGAG